MYECSTCTKKPLLIHQNTYKARVKHYIKSRYMCQKWKREEKKVYDSPNEGGGDTLQKKQTTNNADTQCLRKWQSVSCNWLEPGFRGDFFAGCNLNTPLGYRTSWIGQKIKSRAGQRRRGKRGNEIVAREGTGHGGVKKWQGGRWKKKREGHWDGPREHSMNVKQDL